MSLLLIPATFLLWTFWPAGKETRLHKGTDIHEETNLRLLHPPEQITLPSYLQGSALRDFSHRFNFCLRQSRGVTDAEILELLFRMQTAAGEVKLAVQRSCDAARGIETHAEDIVLMLDEMLDSPDRQIPVRRVEALFRRSAKYGNDATRCQDTFRELFVTLDKLQKDVQEKQRQLDEDRNRSWFQTFLHTIGSIIDGLTALASATAMFLGGPAWGELTRAVGMGMSSAVIDFGNPNKDNNQRKFETLQKADRLLGEAIQQVGGFSIWWQEQSVAIRGLQKDGGLYLGRGEARQQEAKNIKEKWVDVQQHMTAFIDSLDYLDLPDRKLLKDE